VVPELPSMIIASVHAIVSVFTHADNVKGYAEITVAFF
jgi:hypothetical protein